MGEGDARSELIRLAVGRIVEEALEAEVAEAVGRGYYENGAAPGAGYRNGYRRGRLRTAEGAIEYGVPQVADRAESFVARVRAGLAGRTAELEQLAVEMYARGLSTRDIEAAFRDATSSSVLSRTAVSQVTERLWQEYETFAGRDLSEFQVAYFFVDGVDLIRAQQQGRQDRKAERAATALDPIGTPISNCPHEVDPVRGLLSG